MVHVTVKLETRHQEVTVITFGMNFISIFLPVSDVYISTSNDFDPRSVCGYEVNMIFVS